MNWITKIIKAGEKIKTEYVKGLQRKILKKVTGPPVVRDQF